MGDAAAVPPPPPPVSLPAPQHVVPQVLIPDTPALERVRRAAGGSIVIHPGVGWMSPRAPIRTESWPWDTDAQRQSRNTSLPPTPSD